MGKKILVVEDELDAAKILVKRLTNEGFEVSVATDAYQGTSAIFKEKIDLVILDLMLPAGGGMSVLKNVKENPQKAYIPIVVLTGMKDDKVKNEVLGMGADSYLEKPYDWTNLLSTINGIFNKEESH